MAAAEAALDELGVPLVRRHSEAFAPDPFFAAAMAAPVKRVARTVDDTSCKSSRAASNARIYPRVPAGGASTQAVAI